MSMAWSELDLFAAETDGYETLAAALAFVDDDFGLPSAGRPSLVPLSEQTVADQAIFTALATDVSNLDTISAEFKVSTPSTESTLSESSQHLDEETLRTASKPTRKRKNARREELTILRETVADLETRLAAMKRERVGTPPASAESDADPMDAAWEQIAERQQKERERSERENAKLRAMLEDQIRTAKSLERLLLKKQSEPEMSTWEPEKRIRTSKTVNPLQDPIIEAEMRQTMLDMYSETDRIAQDPRFQAESFEPPLRITELKTDNLNRPFIEVLEARLLPFDFLAIGDALWEVWTNKQPDPSKITLLDHVQIAEDFVQRYVEGSFDLRHVKGQFRAKIVSRRFVEADRIVTTGSVLMEPLHLGGKTMNGVYMRTRVWNIIQPRTRAAPNGCKPATPISTRFVYYLSSPQIFDDDTNFEDRRQDIGTLTNFVVNSVQLKSDMNHQILENKLVERLGKLSV
ncbi:hypothetical protein Poli38472_011673 [Pythium oligandrum]|uniref:Uncharacterized protein n=1 Tax=Pythium oligandrum TaxID=41045 RepID=A0A8K1C885_PYTOL|nr:hypothetical protein Poli38472_011673 [Pythium oligandrum]|eukprot:TMW58085.1 hypothetical protein Poli38472_011673 [Pythium oligandrum]